MLCLHLLYVICRYMLAKCGNIGKSLHIHIIVFMGLKKCKYPMKWSFIWDSVILNVVCKYIIHLSLLELVCESFDITEFVLCIVSSSFCIEFKTELKFHNCRWFFWALYMKTWTDIYIYKKKLEPYQETAVTVHIFSLHFRSINYHGESNFSALLTPITFLISYFNSAFNPLLYAFLSRNFRKGMREIILCSFKKSNKKTQQRIPLHVSKSVFWHIYTFITNLITLKFILNSLNWRDFRDRQREKTITDKI